MTRQKDGILHIHGHWKRPSSIVLGRKSYDRVVADDDLQQLFRTLWLEWSWVYVGCGDGLDDPNLGRLLEWGKRWGKSKMPDFFLAREDKAKEIAHRLDKPENLKSIGYPSHDDLAPTLRSITPTARCWPFVRVDDTFPLFGHPFPTRQEYLSGDVPTFAADAEVQRRLQTHGWACVIDVASVGKTTLALRLATAHEQRQHPAFYLDISKELIEGGDAGSIAAVHRLARPGTLLILDNAHHETELVHEIWQYWSARPRDSRGELLLIATEIHRPVVSTPAQDLRFFESHPSNPAILLQPTREDLGLLAKHLYSRQAGGSKCPPMPDPPPDALTKCITTMVRR
ncbi:MAG: SIR2 family protein [Chthoniobacteraceae bacterium]